MKPMQRRLLGFSVLVASVKSFSLTASSKVDTKVHEGGSLIGHGTIIVGSVARRSLFTYATSLILRTCGVGALEDDTPALLTGFRV